MNQRLATPDDMSCLHQLYMDPTINPYLAFDPCTLEEFQPAFEDLMSGGELIICEQDDSIVASYKLVRRQYRLRHIAYIGTVAVSPEFQNQGLGRRIMDSLLKQLTVEGFRRIELFVASDNPRGIHFFQSLGFEIEATLKEYFNRNQEDRYIDEHLMVYWPSSGNSRKSGVLK